MSGHECGCRACAERDALIRAEMAEHQADFERYWDAMHTPRMEPLEGDHETRALRAARVPIAKVSVVG